jgi:putative zinc finger protein
MTVEPMDCAAPERELVPFLAAGSLADGDRARVEAHLAGCAGCRSELDACRGLVAGLSAAHLTPDEVVAAAWEDGPPPDHLADCPRCRDEVDAIRATTADLDRARTRPSLWRRPELAWAAALALAVPAGLFLAGALRSGTPETPVVRGPSVSSRVTAPQPVVLAGGAATVLPRAEVLLDFARPGEAPGRRHEARLVDGRGVTLWEGTLPESAGGRAYLLLDARELASDRLTLEVRRVAPGGTDEARVVYELAAPR